MDLKFDVSPEETKAYRDWKKKHDKTCKFADPMKGGAIGGRLTYKFTPTGLGCLFSVKCACGAEEDFTDVDNW